MKKLWIIILTFSLITCKSQNSGHVYPFNLIENYNGSIELSIEERLLDTPEIIIASLNEFDNVTNCSSYELSTDEKRLFMDYYELLPEQFKEIITEKVMGIYFVDNFLGGGMTMPLFDNSGDMYIVLFFNPEVLRQSISEWLNFRENTAFINNSNISLVVECNSQYYGLLHTLLHEAGHVYDYYNHVTPYVQRFLQNEQSIFPTDFVKDIWVDIDKPIDEFDYVYRENISFYNLGERIEKNTAIEIYSILKSTPFSSIYGSKTWAEDFAEAFTWYYLNKYFEVNYKIILREDNEIILIYEPDKNELIKRRYEILENILEK